MSLVTRTRCVALVAATLLGICSRTASVRADAAKPVTPASSATKEAKPATTKAKPKPVKKKVKPKPKPVKSAATNPKTDTSLDAPAAPPQPSAAASDSPALAPEPIAPAPTTARPAAAVSTRVEVPSTSHIHVDIPAGLQAWLDADDRMRPWLGKAIAAVDTCYASERASNPAVAGTISFSMTMHENARPSAQPGSVPAALAGIVLCVTSHLMSVKMPLFTGNEGDSYNVQVHFTP